MHASDVCPNSAILKPQTPPVLAELGCGGVGGAGGGEGCARSGFGSGTRVRKRVCQGGVNSCSEGQVSCRETRVIY